MTDSRISPIIPMIGIHIFILLIALEFTNAQNTDEYEVHTTEKCYGKTMSLVCGAQFTVRVISARYSKSPGCSPDQETPSSFCSKEEPGNPACVGNSSCVFTTPWVYLSPACGYSNTFTIKYQCVPKGIQWDICEVESLTGLHGYITSPNYPYQYDSAMNCKVKVKAPPGYRLNIYLLDLYLAYYNFNAAKQCIDRVRVFGNDMKTSDMCTGQQRGLVFTSEDREATIHFTSDDHTFRNAKGFWIYYEAFSVDTSPNKIVRTTALPKEVDPENWTKWPPSQWKPKWTPYTASQRTESSTESSTTNPPTTTTTATTTTTTTTEATTTTSEGIPPSQAWGDSVTPLMKFTQVAPHTFFIPADTVRNEANIPAHAHSVADEISQATRHPSKPTYRSENIKFVTRGMHNYDHNPPHARFTETYIPSNSRATGNSNNRATSISNERLSSLDRNRIPQDHMGGNSEPESTNMFPQMRGSTNSTRERYQRKPSGYSETYKPSKPMRNKDSKLNSINEEGYDGKTTSQQDRMGRNSESEGINMFSRTGDGVNSTAERYQRRPSQDGTRISQEGGIIIPDGINIISSDGNLKRISTPNVTYTSLGTAQKVNDATGGETYYIPLGGSKSQYNNRDSPTGGATGHINVRIQSLDRKVSPEDAKEYLDTNSNKTYERDGTYSKNSFHAPLGRLGISLSRMASTTMDPVGINIFKPWTPWYLKYSKQTMAPTVISTTPERESKVSMTESWRTMAQSLDPDSAPPEPMITPQPYVDHRRLTNRFTDQTRPMTVKTTTTTERPSSIVLTTSTTIGQKQTDSGSPGWQQPETFISEEIKSIDESNMPAHIKQIFMKKLRSHEVSEKKQEAELSRPLMKHIAHIDHYKEDMAVTYIHHIPTYPPTQDNPPSNRHRSPEGEQGDDDQYDLNPGDHWTPRNWTVGDSAERPGGQSGVGHGAPHSLAGGPPNENQPVLNFWEIGAIAGGAAGMVLMIIAISITMVFVRRKRIRRLYKQGRASVKRPYKEVILAYGSSPPSSPGLHNLAFDGESPATSVEDISSTTTDGLVPYKGGGSMRSWGGLRPIDEAIEDLYTEVKRCSGRIPVLAQRANRPWNKGKSKSLDDLILKSRLQNIDRRREMSSITMSLSLESFGSSQVDTDPREPEADYGGAYYHSLGSLYSDIALAQVRANQHVNEQYEIIQDRLQDRLDALSRPISTQDRWDALSMPVTPLSTYSPFLRPTHTRHASMVSDSVSYEATLLDRDEDIAL